MDTAIHLHNFVGSLNCTYVTFSFRCNTYLHNYYVKCKIIYIFIFLQILKPVILFLEGHSSHLWIEASKYYQDHNIILYCFLLPAEYHPYITGIWCGSSIMKQNFNVVLEMAWHKTKSNDDGKAVQLAAWDFNWFMMMTGPLDTKSGSPTLYTWGLKSVH